MSEHNAASGRADLSPHTSSVWLPAGTQRIVLIDGTAPPYFSDGGPTVVEVGFDPAGEVVARIDGDTLGEFDGESSAQLSPSLRQLESRGLIALAHGVFATVNGSPAVTVHADPLGASLALSDTELEEHTHPTTDPFPATETFAADEEAEAAALAADAEAATVGGSTAVRRFPRNRNLQAVAVLASALVIGVVGLIGYYYGAQEHGREMTAFMNSKGESTPNKHFPAAPASTSAQMTTNSATGSQPASPSAPTASNAENDNAASGSTHRHAGEPAPAPHAPAANAPAPAPAPGPAPAPAPHAPAQPAPEQAPVPEAAPNQAPIPAPAPPPTGDAGGAFDDVPPLQPILELRW
ncbi:hypothetical protein [Corynebacterium urinipleomorphum]|uniref:hypothetical protein n=1 Tax=Corynebacterium urinipleomorphum TaxID=1852380 RepID=UPI000B354B93|nr:hypothetical protein [Corynebacterium urinipleomorphum]